MNNVDISMEEYHYDLPSDRIAFRPKEQRSMSRLLCFNGETDDHKDMWFRDLPDVLPRGSFVVGNNTRVLPARLEMQRATGGKVEVFLLDPIEPSSDPSVALGSTGQTTWSCMVRGMKKLKVNEELTPLDSQRRTDAQIPSVSATLEERNDRFGLLRFSWNNEDWTFANLIEHLGHVPLPPYIDRDETSSDREDYQTVYAKRDGAVAAPTAGLHFTPEVLDRLRSRDIDVDYVTLHVGAGTFAPVTAQSPNDHTMHVERFEVSLTLLERLLEQPLDKPTVHIGTTTLRTLESIYWIGERMLRNQGTIGIDAVSLEQWYAVDRLESGAPLPSRAEVVSYLVQEINRAGLKGISGETSLMILPGYRFQMCDLLLTNFHQPGSTLILLVAAFLGGTSWRVLYDHALSSGYRFLSYGDTSLLTPSNSAVAV